MGLVLFYFINSALILNLVFGLSQTENFWLEREMFLNEERSWMIGQRLKLTEKEELVDKILLSEKLKELNECFENPGLFAPSINFLDAKPLIEKSKVFKIIKMMPKGGVLHVHDSAGVSFDYVFNNVLNRDNLYLCMNESTHRPQFLFSKSQPDDRCYQPIANYKNTYNHDFKDFLMDKMTLYPSKNMTFAEAYPDINAVWSKFQTMFDIYDPILKYKPVFEDFYYQFLKENYDDNVQYIEARSGLKTFFDFSGKPYNSTEVANTIKQVTERFKKDHPGFNFKLIYAKHRRMSQKSVEDEIKKVKYLIKTFPDLFVGFDLVGQEDLGRPLVDFVQQILPETRETRFFFHAGETNWYGLPTDQNIVDAILLNTSRIGHGYSIIKHPKVMEEVYKREIGIEISPISNQVLMLVKDLRNHPGSILFSQGYPVVISCDDPLMWGSKGLSYDFYEAFMAFTSAEEGLRVLKQLAINSLIYSGMNDQEKVHSLKYWEGKWNIFLDEIIKNYSVDRTNPPRF